MQKYLLRSAVLLGVVAFHVATSNAEASPCLTERDEPVSVRCLNYVDSIIGDSAALRSLGRRLEIANRYEQAVAVYRHVLPHHRSDKTLQQGLIRSRSELRDRAILAGFERPSAVASLSPCWTRRWEAAVTACESELSADESNWSLQERYGDVLRSVGRPRAGLQAYRRSLRINVTNARLQKKHDVLLELVDLEKEELRPEELPQLASDAKPAPDSSTVASDASPTPLPPPLQTGRYRAVVFGNQNYREFEDLESPIADAKAVGDLLRDRYGFEVQTVLDATRYEIFEVLADLRRTSSNYENVLIYYAGHGYLDTTTKRGYWLPVDAEADNAANWVSTSDITNLVAGLQSTHALVIADSCFSGALTRSVDVPGLESRQALLERLASRRSRMILTSGGLEPVLDSGNPFSRHSIFADALLDALENNQTTIEAGRLFVRVRDAVALASDQTPQYAPLRSAGHDGGDFIFVRKQVPQSRIH